jgi:hypothetical protein
MFSGMSIGMYYTTPMIAIFYFFSTQHQINITYYMFVYYFTGNMLFGLVVYCAFVAVVDRPIHALLNLEGDVREANRSTDYKLDSYLENFKPYDQYGGNNGFGRDNTDVSNGMQQRGTSKTGGLATIGEHKDD